MNKKKLLVLALVAVVAFTTGYGVVAKAFPTPYHYGYFYNVFDDPGIAVLPAWGGDTSNCYADGLALPTWVDTANEFISFINCKLTMTDYRSHVGAAFIISTMSGMSNPNPGATEINEFAARVRYADSKGWVNWHAPFACITPNTYYQDDGPGDVAAYGNCGASSEMITFSRNGGASRYIIKRICANPLGDMSPITDDLNFNITGDSTVSNASPTPGSTVTFFHNIQNNGPTGTAPTPIFWIAEKMEPLPVTTVGGPAPWGTLAAGERREVNRHNVIIPLTALPGDRFCERVGWDPINSSGGANGRGTPACATVPYNYTLTPTITVTITSGGVPISGNVAEPGDTITFKYSVISVGTLSQIVTCTYRQATYTGNNQTPPTTLFTPAGANCPPPRTFPGGATTDTATENITAATLNTSLCRSMTITPTTQTGGTQTDQKCAFIAAKPYTRVWGGDVSAGNGLADASGVCTSTANNNGAIVSWNKRAAGSNSGAGVQFAAFALARITDYASALYDPGGAPSPDGLSFADTGTNIANGDFGGGFGTAPCIPDYYATRPATTLAIPATVAAMNTGVYGGSGNITLGGGSIVNPNNRISVYVNGNVYINGNITYSGSWDVTSTPLFELIVNGNIYIDNDITQLDGVYVAQATGTPNTGQIITCATGFSELAVNSLYANCNRKLTVNGLFTANRIQLLRTMGSLSQGNTSEPSTAPNIGEVFNYGPAMWIKQPVRESEAFTPDYDAIISLPPIL